MSTIIDILSDIERMETAVEGKYFFTVHTLSYRLAMSQRKIEDELDME